MIPKSPSPESGRLDAYGRHGLRREAVSFLVHGLILFIAAGRLDWSAGWIYVGLVGAGKVFTQIRLIRGNPELINQRGRFIRPDTPGFDRVFFALFLPAGLAVMAAAGLDGGRFHWAPTPPWAAWPGVIGLAAGYALASWAMEVNRHFETTVRIQTDRNHAVCTAGPYRLVRHPGYLAIILHALSGPLILGSGWAYLPTGVLVAAVIARTFLEDRTLQEKLPGYRAYAARIRYRLLPLIW